jgi:glutaconyl-CoA/methylmalonyl-CoA decarboxylase subunit delta
VPEWLEVGGRLTLYGLSLVFLVLALLWGLITVLLRADRPAPVGGTREPATDPPLDPVLVAAVAIALRAHLDAGRWHPSRRRDGSPQSRWASAGREGQTHHWPLGRRG